MGPTSILSVRNGPHVGPMILAIGDFTLKYGFESLTWCDQATPACADMRPWQRNGRGNNSVMMLSVSRKFFRKACKTNHNSFPVALSPYFCYMVGDSSDEWHLCKFRWESSEKLPCHTTWPHDGTPIKQEQMRNIFWNPGVGIAQFIAFTYSLDSFFIITFMFQRFVVLAGVCIIVGTAKIFRHLSILHTKYSHVIIGIKSCHHKIVSISPRESV